SSDKHSLVPNLYRTEEKYFSNISDPKNISRIEGNIDFTFSRKSSMFFSSKQIENNLWNRYFLKQHYGVKTRLLDWTESALIALFFAVKEHKSLENGKVWILSPIKLNNYSVSKLINTDKNFDIIPGATKMDKGPLLNEKDELRVPAMLTKYYKMQYDVDEKLYPLAIYPTHLDERMAAQQACFTIFGNVVNGLENHDSEKKFVESICIHKNYKKDILRQLKQLGISYYTIYPDLDGLGKEINFAHSGEVFDLTFDNDWGNDLMDFQSE
ncbi:FRG domain-containing protein, partial [bacterium]